MKLHCNKLVFFIFILCFSFIKAQNIDSLTIKANSSTDSERLSALGELGNIYFYNQPKKSDSLYREALQLAIKLNNQKEESKFLNYIGTSFNETSEADSILFYQNKSLLIAQKIKDSSLIASAYGNIGNAYLIKGEYNIAIENYNKALVVFENQNNIRSQAMIFGTFANIYLDLEDYNQAIYYYNKARTTFKKINFHHGFASSTINLGICNQRLENYKEAIQFLEEGKQICEENNFKRLLRVANLQLGNINFDYYKNYTKAEVYYNKTKQLSELFGDKEGIAQSNLQLGNIAVIKNESNKAVDYYKNSALIFKEIEKKGAYSSALTHLINELKTAGKYKEATNYYEELIILNDSIINEATRIKSLELLTEFDVKQKNKEIEIQNLIVKKQELEITKQRNIRIFFSIFSGLLIILLYFVWKVNKFKKLNEHYKIKSKQIELEQRLLRSQMNPHFIFNALNSIQSYVSENNTMNSEIYLSRFSRLMRQILEHSQEEFILLKDDINALESYMTLEQLRFDNSFDYSINYNSIDIEKCMIPPMLLQPFIENAILHGFESKNEKGSIIISFSQKNKLKADDHYATIICSIEDNGIGRDAASKKESSPNGHHVSLALNLIQERLANYSEITNETYQVNIDDLFEDNIPLGTKISFEIPYTQELI